MVHPSLYLSIGTNIHHLPEELSEDPIFCTHHSPSSDRQHWLTCAVTYSINIHSMPKQREIVSGICFKIGGHIIESILQEKKKGLVSRLINTDSLTPVAMCYNKRLQVKGWAVHFTIHSSRRSHKMTHLIPTGTTEPYGECYYFTCTSCCSMHHIRTEQ